MFVLQEFMMWSFVLQMRSQTHYLIKKGKNTLNLCFLFSYVDYAPLTELNLSFHEIFGFKSGFKCIIAPKPKIKLIYFFASPTLVFESITENLMTRDYSHAYTPAI